MDWYFEPDLIIEDDADRIVIFAGANADQEGILFMRADVEEHWANTVTISTLRREDAKKIRDHLNKWLEWCEERDKEKHENKFRLV